MKKIIILTQKEKSLVKGGYKYIGHNSSYTNTSNPNIRVECVNVCQDEFVSIDSVDSVSSIMPYIYGTFISMMAVGFLFGCVSKKIANKLHKA